MALIVDAYNVLHCTHILSARHALMGTEQLCRLIAASHWRTGRMVVVCDGAKPTLVDDDVRDVELIYAGGGKDADSLIERMIDDDSAPRQLTIVTNDRRIQRAAKRRKARVMASEDFLRGLVRKPPSAHASKPDSVDDTAAWMEEFDLDASVLGHDDPTDTAPRTRQTQHDGAPATDTTSGASEPPAPPSAERRPDESDSDYWLRQFGFDDQDPLKKD